MDLRARLGNLRISIKAGVLSIVAFALVAASARANYLSYVDENGTRHIVQSKDEIPKKYRKDVKVSAAGDPKKSFFTPTTKYVPDPNDSPRASCEKKAQHDFEDVKKKILSSDQITTNDDFNNYAKLKEHRDSEVEGCQNLAGESAHLQSPPAATPPFPAGAQSTNMMNLNPAAQTTPPMASPPNAPIIVPAPSTGTKPNGQFPSGPPPSLVSPTMPMPTH